VYRQLTRGAALEARVMQGEQSNTSVVYGNRLILKLFRKIEPGESLDAELGRFLTERGFEGAPAMAGSLDYVQPRAERMTLATVQAFVPNEGDAWEYTLDELAAFYERAGSKDPVEMARLVEHPPPHGEQAAEELVGAYLQAARTLGRRTAELHAVLGSEREEEAFVPEAFSQLYQRSLYQSMRNQAIQVLDRLGRNLHRVPEDARADAQRLLEMRDGVLARLRSVTGKKIETARIRCHGDYHLGQVLYTGKDFVITDFEGEPARALSERRIKRSPLRDVAGMLRSFHYAAFTALFRARESGTVVADAPEPLQWAELWYRIVGSAFLASYLEVASDGGFLPDEESALRRLLDAFVVEKAIYELGYEIDNRPDWLAIPIQGILRILAE
jgi:maltose alpha-D-glucosyltransferase/alpha-amylase